MKQKRYWLRGGVTGLGIFIVFSILSLLIDKIFGPGDYGITLNEILVYFPFGYIYESLTNKIFPMLLIFVINLLIFSAVGVLIGWLYGKIKDRNKVGNVI